MNISIVARELRDSKMKSHGIDPSRKSELWLVPVAATNEAFATLSETTFEDRLKLIKEYQSVYESCVDEFTEV